jgi:heat shock protein HslJ
MKKSILLIVIILIVVVGMYYISNTPDSVEAGYLNTTYLIDNKPVELTNGLSEEQIPNSASKVVTKYFGNELKTDLNNDGREDIVFLLTQETSGSGVFFYVAASLNTEEGWVGSHTTFLSDRIAPQTTEISENFTNRDVIVVNYADRNPDEPMSAKPSIGQSVWLKFDPETMQFGEIVKDFEGEANPEMMTLHMKSWEWIQTDYNDGTVITPNKLDNFIIIFKEDNTFSATTDCNLMSSTYEIDGNKIEFSENISMTRKFCQDSQEQEFATILRKVSSFFFTNKGELVLETKLDGGSSTFR